MGSIVAPLEYVNYKAYHGCMFRYYNIMLTFKAFDFFPTSEARGETNVVDVEVTKTLGATIKVACRV